MLLKITDTMRWDYNIYYSGWHRAKDINDFTDPYAITIHHPLGDIKKISKGVASNSVGAGCFKSDCWKVDNIIGGIYRGSSGAPLFSNDHKVIGVVRSAANSNQSTAQEACSSVWTSGAYGKLGEAWDEIGPHLAINTEDWDMVGIDPFQSCIPKISLYGQLFPGNDYQPRNQITIQAANEIELAPNNIPTLIDGSGIPGNSILKADYIFQAQYLIRINSGFSIKAGNKMSLQISPCLPFVGCGFNHNNTPVLNNDDEYSYKKSRNFSYSKIKFFPTLAENLLNIETNDLIGKYNIKIQSSIGQIVLNNSISFDGNLGISSIDISQIPSGIYYIYITDSENSILTMEKIAIVK